MTVRVRFAPSPTGYLHIGGARTALFNWLFARRHGGQFILRIEDTDQSRYVEGAVEAIMDGLRWMGIDWDEGPDVGGDFGPYVQTDRADLYQKWATWLVEKGHAYKCFMTAEELSALREEQAKQGLPQGYDRRYRDTPTEEVAQLEAEGKPYVIRFKAPLEGETTVHDLIRGDITVPNEQIEDMVLLKSDGLPTYHLANVVDDHFMQITHIMRAAEWISTAPLHYHMYAAFGWQLPKYAHLPLILNPSGKGKLSKRTQAFTDGGQEILVKVSEFADAGYPAEAVVNFLTNVGWSFGDDREIFTPEEAQARFTIEGINPANSQLPYSKLDWLSNQYMQMMDAETLANRTRPFLEAQNYEVNMDALVTLMPAMSKRMQKYPDALPFLQFVFDDVPLDVEVEQLTHKKMGQALAHVAFQKALALVQTVDTFDVESLGDGLRKIGEEQTDNNKAGPFLGTMRFAITGQKVSPPLFESMVALGRERVMARLQEVLAIFENA